LGEHYSTAANTNTDSKPDAFANIDVVASGIDLAVRIAFGDVRVSNAKWNTAEIRLNPAGN
jgi:hypothetical protein